MRLSGATGYVVGEYNATTGAAINANLITFANLALEPSDLALSGNNLYIVTDNLSNFYSTIGEYNATTGAAINANLITVSNQAGGGNPLCGLALSGNNLYVSNLVTVGEYNATTGAAINANLITGQFGGEVVSGNEIYAENGVTVGEYNATTGAAINANFITGLNNDWELALSGNSLYVASYNGISTVGEYNATTGAAINANLIHRAALLN